MNLTHGLKQRVKRLEESYAPKALGIGALVEAARKQYDSMTPEGYAALAERRRVFREGPEPRNEMSARVWRAERRLHEFKQVECGKVSAPTSKQRDSDALLEEGS